MASRRIRFTAPFDLSAAPVAVFALRKLGRGAVEDDLSAVLAGPGAKLDHPIRAEDHLRIVFHHDGDVLVLRQRTNYAQQSLHVSRVQADGGLVEDEHGAIERRAERAGERHALSLAAG